MFQDDRLVKCPRKALTMQPVSFISMHIKPPGDPANYNEILTKHT